MSGLPRQSHIARFARVAVACTSIGVAATFGEWYLGAIGQFNGVLFGFHRTVANYVFRLLGGDMSGLTDQWQHRATRGLTVFGPVAALALLLYLGLTRLAIRAHAENETRCRRCGYILRGLQEPICSECGERI